MSTTSGDLERVFERAGGSLAGFLDYASRLRVMHDRRDDALVVLTRTDPLALLLPARRALEQALPTLTNAAWALFWDPERDPDFMERAQASGSFDDPDAEAPIWIAPNRMAFLVLSPRTQGTAALKKRVAALAEKPHRGSGVQAAVSSRGGPASKTG